MTSKLRVQQVRSLIGQREQVRKVIRALGLRRPGHAIVVDNTPSFRGAVKKVLHLVRVEETDG